MDDDDLRPPPPAYSEQEFDQKVSSALEISLRTLQPDPPTDAGDNWEEWDEGAFDAAAAIPTRPTNNSTHSWSTRNADSSSGPLSPRSPERHSFGPRPPPPVTPLRIQKKSSAPPTSGHSGSSKPRPSWYAEAGLSTPSRRNDATNSLSQISAPSHSSGSTSTSVPVHHHYHHHHHIPPEDEDRSVPPPPFAAAGLSLDRPPFEGIMMSYNGRSRPSSPRASVSRYSEPPFHQQQQPQTQSHYIPETHPRHPSRQSYPPHTPNQRLGHQSTSSFSSPFKSMESPYISRVDFNPAIAYDKRGTPGVQEQSHIHAVDPKAFYNSAVSSHLSTPPRPAQNTQPYGMNVSPQQRRQSSFQPSQSQSGFNQQLPHSDFSAGYNPSNAGIPLRQTTWLSPTTAASTHSPIPSGPYYSASGSNVGASPSRWATSEHQLRF